MISPGCNIKDKLIKCKLNLVFVALFFLLAPNYLTSSEWVIYLKPSEVQFRSSKFMKFPLDFLEKGEKNKSLVNLSFFTYRHLIGPYKDNTQIYLKNRRHWPTLFLDSSKAFICEYGSKMPDTYRYAASGYPLLMQNAVKCKLKRSSFIKRKCPRTIIGIHKNGQLFILITTGDLLHIQTKLVSLGCKDAINFDGGSSTFLYTGASFKFTSKRKRRYPSILMW